MLLYCPLCRTGVGTKRKLGKHLWDGHLDEIVPNSSKRAGRVECPSCDAPITRESILHHGSCLDGLVHFDRATVQHLYQSEIVLCPSCGDPNYSQKELHSHLRTEHNNRDLYDLLLAPGTDRCVGCGEPNQGRSRREHAIHYLNQHPAFDEAPPGSGVRCPLGNCDAETASTPMARLHIWATHYEGAESVDEAATCPGCGGIVGFTDAITHLQCFDELTGPESLEYFSIPYNLTECFLCEFETYNRGKLDVHIKDEHVPEILDGEDCPGCGRRLVDASRSELSDHYLCFGTSTGVNVPLAGDVSGGSCPDCQESFSDIDSLSDHVASSHPTAIFPDTACSWCGDGLRLDTAHSHRSCVTAAASGENPPTEEPIGDPALADSETSSLHSFVPPKAVGTPPKTRLTADDPLSRSERQEYYDDLYEFLELERESARDEAWELYDTNSAHELGYRNQAIPDLMAMGEQSHPDYEDQYVFEHMVPDHVSNPNNLVEHYGIYPGTEVIVDVDRSTAALPTEAIVTFVEDQTIGLALKPTYDYDFGEVRDALTNLSSGPGEATYSVYYLLNPTPYDREEAAIDRARKDERTDGVLTGEATLGATSPNVATLSDPSLNPSQRNAVDRAAGAAQVACIHGPPGTGKTRTLTALIKAAVAAGNRVLAVAHSNQAVDNLIAGTSTMDDPDPDSLYHASQETSFSIARVGQNSTNPVVREHYATVGHTGAEVVAGTTSATEQLSSSFDLVVVDEATQASQPASLIPMTKGDRIVLAGDHKQLPPYASSEDAKREEMHVSLFEHVLNVYGEDVAERLTTQYRMHESIATYPSEQFYEGTLSHGPQNATWTIDDLAPILGIQVEGGERVRSDSKSKYNPREAKIVANQVERLEGTDVDPDDIGVITPYTAQIGTIANELHNVDIDDPSRIDIDTVDSFQGGEREAIVVSFVRSNDRNTAGFLEFPEEGPRRLNVALTRAKKRLVLVGDFDTLGTVADHRSPNESCAPLYDALRKYCRRHDRFEKRNTVQESA